MLVVLIDSCSHFYDAANRAYKLLRSSILLKHNDYVFTWLSVHCHTNGKTFSVEAIFLPEMQKDETAN